MAIYIRKFPGSTEFLDEIRKETDRGAALIVASLLDERLAAILKAFCIDSKKIVNDLLENQNAPLGTFSARISAAYALALIEDEELEMLNVIR